ncbi:MAG TPA: sigma factor, partial [Kofleriaceae bacterium]|nr:sigma factor [Kofleriaceae bacterium]
MEDDEIRAALRRGDEGAAFGLLLQAHGKTIFARCHRILHDETAAEDVMQQVLIAAFKHRKKLIQVESIRGWLICGAVRRCIDA